MRYAIAAAIILTAGIAQAREAPSSQARAINNNDVRTLCVEITGKEAGHPLRDCMSSVDMFLERHAVARSTP
jgi:hypothetical protein